MAIYIEEAENAKLEAKHAGQEATKPSEKQENLRT